MKTIEVLYEDEYLLAINKPADMHSVNLAGKEKQNSIAEAILDKDPSAKQVGLKPEDAGLVNRLDFETSGILIAAKDKTTWKSLHELFKKEKVSKTYLALLEGQLAPRTPIENYIGASGRSAKKMKLFKSKPSTKYRAQVARSEFRLLKFFAKENISLAEISISTGRRHQIRIHAKELKHPIVGDLLYGSKMLLGDFSAEFTSRQFFLHAYKYEFIHPANGKAISIKSELKNLGRFFSL